MILFNDMVQHYSEKHRKLHDNIPSSLSDGDNILVSASEVMMQAVRAKFVEEGCVAEDDWFISTSSCLKLRTHFGLDSALTLKNNNAFHPMDIFCRMLQETCSNHSSGHWVEIKTSIIETHLMSVACA